MSATARRLRGPIARLAAVPAVLALGWAFPGLPFAGLAPIAAALLLGWVAVVDGPGILLARFVASRPDRARLPAVRVLRDPGARIGAALVLFFATLGALAPVIAPSDPMTQAERTRLCRPDGLDRSQVGLERPWRPLGGDDLGRCLLSRVVHGARLSLIIGSLSVALALVFGVPAGLVAGYMGEKLLTGRDLLGVAAGGALLVVAALLAAALAASAGWVGGVSAGALLRIGAGALGLLGASLAGAAVAHRAPFRRVLLRPLVAIDTLVSRSADLLLAFPSILLAITIMAVAGRSVANVIVAVAVVNIPVFVRQVRASALAAREVEYVEAARALGATDLRIMARAILPACIAPIVVLATLEVGSAVLSAAGLSFLGLGTEPDLPEWGAMLAGTRRHIGQAPWVVLPPGLALTLTVLGFNLLGDALRDALDPRSR